MAGELQFETDAAFKLYDALSQTHRKRFPHHPVPKPYEFMRFRDDDHARQVGAVLLPEKPHVHAGNVLRRHLRWLRYGTVGPDGWQWRYESYETTACELDLISPSAEQPRDAGKQAVKAATNSLVKAGILQRESRLRADKGAERKVNHYRLTEPGYCAVIALLWWCFDEYFNPQTLDLRTFRRVWTEMRYPSGTATPLRKLMTGWQSVSVEHENTEHLGAVTELAQSLMIKKA
jgi:hypothetical protein